MGLIMSMGEWDRTAQRLWKIESGAWWINHYAEELLHAVELIQSMPKFETRAEDALKTAHEKLAKAIQLLMIKEREK